MRAPSNGKIKVTHLLHTMAYGGVETVLINWLVYAPKTELDIQLVIFENPDGSEKAFIVEAEKASLVVNTIPWARSKPIFKSARALDALMKQHGTQVLHAHNAYAEVVALISGKRNSIKLVSTIYVWAGIDFGIKRFILQKISAAIIKRFDLLTVQCEKARNESVDWGFNKQDVVVLPSGYILPPPSTLYNSDKEKNRRQELEDKNRTVVCNVARLYPEKGQARMLTIWKRIIAKCPNVVLWIYGVGPLQEELEQQVASLELQESVVFKGFTDNLMNELELHTSYNEGVPIAICAGMAAGLPIISTAVGGIPEVIKDQRTGLLVDVDDDLNIEMKTIELINDPQLRIRLGGAAKHFIETEYSMDAAVTILTNTYKSLV
jgi:glycosyltransferase involved in cell wall biosynthesis